MFSSSNETDAPKTCELLLLPLSVSPCRPFAGTLHSQNIARLWQHGRAERNGLSSRYSETRFPPLIRPDSKHSDVLKREKHKLQKRHQPHTNQPQHRIRLSSSPFLRPPSPHHLLLAGPTPSRSQRREPKTAPAAPSCPSTTVTVLAFAGFFQCAGARGLLSPPSVKRAANGRVTDSGFKKKL